MRLTGRVALGVAALAIRDAPEPEIVAVVAAAVDAGVRIVDTARAYAPARDARYGEQVVARALSGRDDVLVSTKGGHFRIDEDRWGVDNSPERLRRDIDDSRAALGVDRLGLYYLHRADDETVPLAESMGALEEARRDGRVAAVGISNATVEQLELASAVAELGAVQNRFSAADDENRDVVAWCTARGVPFFAYSPLGGGGGAAGLAARLPRTAALATARGVSIQRLVLRATLAASPVLSVVAGAGRPVTARDSAAAESEPWDEELSAAFEADRGAAS